MTQVLVFNKQELLAAIGCIQQGDKVKITLCRLGGDTHYTFGYTSHMVRLTSEAGKGRGQLVQTNHRIEMIQKEIRKLPASVFI